VRKERKQFFKMGLKKIKSAFSPGLPDFSWSKHTKTEKMYQMTPNYTKRLYIITNDRKIFQKVLKYYNIIYSKVLGIFGLKTNHLATLLQSTVRLKGFLHYLSLRVTSNWRQQICRIASNFVARRHATEFSLFV
jgi:hypothetical protein